MSLTGSATGTVLRGKISSLETISGYSAYEIAVINGFSGTEAEWLESLKGEPGKDGSITFEELTEEQKALLKGEKGEDGVIFIPAVDGAGNLSWTNDGGLDNPATVNIKGADGAIGADGKDGAAATVRVGTVTTLPAGSAAIVENSGTETDAVLNFSIPQGAAGRDGTGSGDMSKDVYDTNNSGVVDNAEKLGGKLPADFAEAVHAHTAAQVTFADGDTFQQKYDSGELKGADGAAGAAGADGADGAAATISVGSVMTLPAGSYASVENVGTATAAKFDFSIPRGADGAQGEAGPNQVSTTTATDITGILKGDGSTVSAAAAGTDYVSPDVLNAANGVATLDANTKVQPSQTSAHMTSYTDSVTLSAADYGCLLFMENTAAATVTIPSGLQAGAEIEVMQYSTGEVTIVAEGNNVKLNGTVGGSVTISGQYASVVLKCKSSVVWVAQGAIS